MHQATTAQEKSTAHLKKSTAYSYNALVNLIWSPKKISLFRSKCASDAPMLRCMYVGMPTHARTAPSVAYATSRCTCMHVSLPTHARTAHSAACAMSRCRRSSSGREAASTALPAYGTSEGHQDGFHTASKLFRWISFTPAAPRLHTTGHKAQGTARKPLQPWHSRKHFYTAESTGHRRKARDTDVKHGTQT